MELDDQDSTVKRCISCTNVPLQLLEKIPAKKHFRKFGKIVRMLLRPKSKTCVIEYESEASAETAVAQAGQYNGQIFTVVKALKSPKRRIKKTPDPDWLPDHEIQAELEAMGAKVNYNLRPEVMVVDPVTPVPPKKKQWKVTANWNLSKAKARDSGSSFNSSILPPEQMELLTILKQPAYSAEERYRVLEARDKLIRLHTKKHTDLQKATHTVGTCPDMCPEKERLMRETQHQVAIYEQEPGGRGMNPSLAIKQYSRSSADQEVPLPHELRPVSVLQLTMGYLMHKIMDLCDNPDTNFGEWYHFVWDRTRGIRKDITQQELCCQGSVQLVEQCARFHIHCSARLVAEDPSVFDQKINTENLTKCLQTLKYMYHDLEVKNEVCSNEAEFRGYVILLNLNDGNFMWEVQQLKPDIQTSAPVKFALKVYSALDKNNYVKFFKLVQSTTYLNACILLRYFTQVRLRAVQTVLKSSAPRSPYTQFPLSELNGILAFEGLASTKDFLEYYGLCMNENKTHVILDRKMFSMPALPYALDRAMKVIETKRTCSVGEVVSGEALPPRQFEHYTPHDSFDVGGYINISESFPDFDSALLDKDVPDRPVSKVTKETKLAEDLLGPRKSTGVDSFHKPTPQAAKSYLNLFRNKQILDSRSNSPLFGFDTVDKASSLKSDTVRPFWGKTDQASTTTYTAKPENDNQNVDTSLQFGQKKSTDEFSFKPFASSAREELSQLFGDGSKSTAVKEQQQKSIFGESKVCAASTESRSEIFGGFGRKPATIFGGFSQKMQPPVATTDKMGMGTSESESIFGKPAETFGSQPSTGGFTYKIHITRANQPVFVAPASGQTTQSTITLGHFPASRENLEYDGPSEEELRENVEKEEERTEKVKQRQREEEKQRNVEQEEQLLLAKKLMEEKQMVEARRKEQERLRLQQERLEQQKLLEERKRLEEIRQREETKRLKELKRREDLKRAEQLKREEEEKRMAMEKEKALEEKRRREGRLQEISENIKTRKVRKFFTIWRGNIITNKRKRKAMEYWPVWISSNTVQEEAHQLQADGQDLTLKYMKRYRSGLPDKVRVEQEQLVRKVDLMKLTSHLLLQRCTDLEIRRQSEIFWKVDVSLPDSNEMKSGLCRLEETLSTLFDWDQQNNFCLLEQFTDSTNKITYCINKQGDRNSGRSVQGFVFIADFFDKLFCNRIKDSVKKLGKKMSVPVVIVLQSKQYDESQLLSFVEDGYVSEYVVICNYFTKSNVAASIEQALVFLAKHLPKPPSLELDLLSSFLHKHLATEIWQRMASHAKWTHPYKLCLTNPKVVFNLYNEAIDRLSTIIFSEANYEHPEFPDVFREFLANETPHSLPCDYKYFPSFWKDGNYRRVLRRVLDDLKLPPFEAKWPPKDERGLEKVIFEFCGKFFRRPEKKFYVVMASILRNFDPTSNYNEINAVLWTDVMETFAREKLKEVDFSLRETYALNAAALDELIVVYDKYDLQKYREDAWFYLNNPTVRNAIDIREQKYEQTREEFDFNMDCDIDLEKALADVTNYGVKNVDEVRKAKADLSEFKVLMDDLEESMAIQKKISLKFEETLKLVLEDK